MNSSIRAKYQQLGVKGFYSQNEKYKNPHEALVHKVVQENFSHYRSVLDLACGNGEVTKALPPSCLAFGSDPYLLYAYRLQTRRPCYPYSFEQIASGETILDQFEAVICSFALHLAPKSLLPALLYQLSLVSRELVILSPTKKPEIQHWRWELVQQGREYDKDIGTVHYRRYVLTS